MKPTLMWRARVLVLLLLGCMGVAACVQAPVRRHEGEPVLRRGQGGAREHVGGVDIWMRGEPPRPYEVLAYTTMETAEGWVGERFLLRRVAARVRDTGGDAALLGDQRSRLVALQRAGSHTALAESRRIVEISIVRYR
ncbi:hypothetical protein [Cupriavidus alkaliphilus]|uniref:hypothetical protein n=1 Tax=Cupriavidus alkaliphilus TaxID=942866 RepID=UPI000DC25EFD|nr:hypothetical protein [Cupriavidus alkaliphilus]MBB3013546.1 hypothetical protein [Cupriavidus alkaliphilus]RAS12136.1 hypothetical protein C7415_101170 [Cupriavidus alkaliphilus]